MVYFLYDNKEQTQLNRSQQLLALHKRLIDGLKQNWQRQNDWTTVKLWQKTDQKCTSNKYSS